MHGNKKYILNPIIIGKREIYPIVNLSFLLIKNTFLNIEYKVVAIKINENSNIYYKNISLSESEFKKIKNKV